ncbi:S66 family peptidase [Microlunatus parietis]|uniref:Muramoyltetrapeptide carboxypeptidase LdcA involved in peptidoglycan recycling n=1 Tax=Microlunatus parietis TaxID=682979 RepID=A0A7Y9LCM4_9ACTN|nr:S66 peptidase family protein [Microlunatus parietis]NYE74999.1 muramoyltetrapeptide carboxypeptidase LdcA involved in peptidoglycan recycling [Microlunatus parietis]
METSEPIVPAKLRPGDTVRVIAPARSRAFVLDHDHSAVIERRFAELGLRVTFGRHVDERDAFESSSIESRVADLHEAFAAPEVRGILTVIGGFNSNELLPYLDWELVAANPKIFCGYSDITALQNAILARTGMITYSGPHWSTFGMRDHLEPTVAWFRQACLADEPYPIRAAGSWTDDPWFLDQDDRTVRPTDGWWALTPGTARGRLVGGNLCTLNLLQGTPWWPSLDGAVLAVEDDYLTNPHEFARDLTSLLQLPDAAGLRGLLIGRFQANSGVTRDLLEEIVRRQPVLAGLPVLANLDFGHTNPIATLPIGGDVELITDPEPVLRIHTH